MGRVAIVENLQRGDNASLCYSWNLASSSAKTSSLDRLVLIFSGHMLGTIGQSNTYFFLLPLTQRLMSLWKNQNLYSTLLGERKFFLSPLYVGAGMSYLPVPTLALHIVHVMACSVQHCLANLGGNLAICHLEARQSVSNTDVIWATSWSVEFNNFSMRWQVARVLGREME